MEKEAKPSIEQRAMDELIHMRKDAKLLKKRNIRKAINELKDGKFERAEQIFRGEALEAGEHALVADHIGIVMGHAPGSAPGAWNSSEFYGELASELREKITKEQ